MSLAYAMPITAATSIEYVERIDIRRVTVELPVGRLVDRAKVDFKKNEELKIADDALYLNAASGWLKVVESRIRDSILPTDYSAAPSTEWLNRDAANTAIKFFQTGADLLPAEPYIYATKSGDLVAEFETTAGSLTAVVSKNETVLFAVLENDPLNPREGVTSPGSKRFREELRSFTKEFMSGSNGKMDAAG